MPVTVASGVFTHDIRVTFCFFGKRFLPNIKPERHDFLEVGQPPEYIQTVPGLSSEQGACETAHTESKSYKINYKSQSYFANVKKFKNYMIRNGCQQRTK